MIKTCYKGGFLFAVYGASSTQREHGPAHVHAFALADGGCFRTVAVKLVVSKKGVSHGVILPHTNPKWEPYDMTEEQKQSVLDIVTRNFRTFSTMWREAHAGTSLAGEFTTEKPDHTASLSSIAAASAAALPLPPSPLPSPR